MPRLRGSAFTHGRSENAGIERRYTNRPGSVVVLYRTVFESVSMNKSRVSIESANVLLLPAWSVVPRHTYTSDLQYVYVCTSARVRTCQTGFGEPIMGGIHSRDTCHTMNRARQ